MSKWILEERGLIKVYSTRSFDTLIDAQNAIGKIYTANKGQYCTLSKDGMSMEYAYPYQQPVFYTITEQIA